MTRDEVSALLPFLANDTLTGEERTEVEVAVREDADLAAELEALRAIRTTMQAEDGYSPGEIGLARLMRDVDAQPVAAPIAAPDSRSGIRRPMIWQAIAAALLAVVVGQAVFQTGSDAPGGFELAGDGAAPITAAFAPDTAEADLRALLLEAGVVIVDGPSALGLYQLAPLDGTDLTQAEMVLGASPLVESLEVTVED